MYDSGVWFFRAGIKKFTMRHHTILRVCGLLLFGTIKYSVDVKQNWNTHDIELKINVETISLYK